MAPTTGRAYSEVASEAPAFVAPSPLKAELNIPTTEEGSVVIRRTTTYVVMATLLSVGALALPGPAASRTTGDTDATTSARPSLKGVWQGQFTIQTLRIRISSFRKPSTGSSFQATQYDGSPGNFESPDCEITLRFKRRAGLKYYFKGSFKDVGLGCPADHKTQTVVLRRSGKRLIFQTKVDGDETKGTLKRR